VHFAILIKVVRGNNIPFFYISSDIELINARKNVIDLIHVSYAFNKILRIIFASIVEQTNISKSSFFLFSNSTLDKKFENMAFCCYCCYVNRKASFNTLLFQ